MIFELVSFLSPMRYDIGLRIVYKGCLLGYFAIEHDAPLSPWCVVSISSFVDSRDNHFFDPD